MVKLLLQSQQRHFFTLSSFSDLKMGLNQAKVNTTFYSNFDRDLMSPNVSLTENMVFTQRSLSCGSLKEPKNIHMTFSSYSSLFLFKTKCIAV